MDHERDAHYEELLVIRSQQGETAAFDELVARWQPRLWRYARLRTGDDTAAWDVVQETWMAVVSRLTKLDNPRSFGAWIYRIAGTTGAQWHRRRVRRHKLRDRYRQEQMRSESSAGQDQGMDTVSLHKALQQLSSDHLAVVSLSYGEGIPVQKIARMLDIPEGTVKSRLYHARQKLRQILQDSGNE